ncbi:MAG: DUF4230 domain-containing protein [Chloroflexi bacterium]|nr:MAG: DUF4230 domain-containing protein [Chloroflexota bacterium]
MNQETKRSFWLAGVIGLVALVIIALIAFFAGSAVGSGIGSLLSGPSEPTATPLPPPVVTIQGIKSQAKLAVVEYTAVTEIYTENPPEGLIDELLGTKEQLLMLVYGDVRAGFDLQDLPPENLWVDGTRVRLVLPPPQILNSSIDFDRTHIVYYKNNLLFEQNDPNLQGEALQKARQALEEAAVKAGILEQANRYGQLYFENFLYSLGFTDVEVAVDAQIFGK